MKKQILLGAAALMLPALAAAQLRGTVYNDANGNGLRDASEKGMNGISVSDGRSVVKTSANGTFELPMDPKARFVTVTSPSGYKPGDSHYLKINPKEGTAYDFGLVKTGNTGAFEFLQIADTETHTSKAWLDNLKEYVKTNPTAFIMHTGDICYMPGLDYHAVNIRSKQMGVPMYYVIGNHDLVAGDYGEQYFENYFGPTWYSFEVGNVHFLALPMLGGDHAPSYTKKQVLEWIKNDLAQADPNKKVIMFNHDLWFQGDDVVLRAGSDSIDMKKHNLEAFIYGHWHSQYLKTVDGVKTYCASTPDKGGIDHSPACFRVFSIDAQGNVSDKTRARYTQIPGTLTTALPAQHDTLTALAGGVVPVRVNAYRTVSPVTAVRVSLIENGRRGRAVALTPQTDWAWSGMLPVAGKTGVRDMVTEADFADGTRLVEQRSFVLTDAPVAVTVGEDWGNLGGNAAHAGVVAQGGVSSSPICVWSQNAGGNIYMASPVVGGGMVFVGTIDDDNLKKCRVVAYDAVTGRELWRYKTDNSVKNTIVYSDGLVLACDAEMRLYAIDAKTGKLVWDRNLSRNILPENLHGLAVTDGVVYAGQGGDFTALNVKDGSVIWKNSAWRGGEGTQSTATVGEGVAVASAHWNGLFAHDAADGKLLWRKQDSKIRFRDGSPVIYDGNIYLASRDELFLINPKSGDVLKSAVQEGVSFEAASAPVVTEKMIYVATADKGMMAFDRLTFKPVWNYRTAPAMFYSVPYSQDYQQTVETSPVLIGGTLVFGASDGYLYGVNAQTGRFQWKRNLGAPIFSSPAVSGDAMYVADFSGNIYCFKISK